MQSLFKATLPIIALARAGAGELAWRRFREAGLENVRDDPAVLSVKGRLLKDQAIAAKGPQRRKLYRESASAYASAARLSGATYPLINAATLSLLAGEREQSKKLARAVLHRIEKGDEAETPYWKGATIAEAQLLLGHMQRAKSALAHAIALAPRAYEDHASTLRQFGLILRELRANAKWLDAYRPPRALHFAGHMRVAPDDRKLARQAREIVESERVGFGYGALAAGADIVIAEAVLDAGAELEIILPAPLAQFRKVSVAPFGQVWLRRFDRVLKRAETVQVIAVDTGPESPLAIQLAAEVAMGLAAMQASLLMTEAVQLLVLEKDAKQRANGSEDIRAIWRKSGRREHVLLAASNRERARPPHAGKGSDRLAAVLRIELADASASLLAKGILSRIAAVLSRRRPLVVPRGSGNRIDLCFDAPIPAAKAGLEIARAIGSKSAVKIAGDYGVARRIRDPLGGAPLLTGGPAECAGHVALSTPEGAFHVTGNFAAALYAAQGAGRPRLEHVGELPEAGREPVRLYSLRP